jgi:hypothetical protein
MALNLVRNSRVFFTTNVEPTTGVIKATGAASTNTFELQVLDGFQFSQNTSQDTITISEAGGAPVRGQRSFNTALAPVDFSMSTYIRPSFAGSVVSAEESVLWNALLGINNIDSGSAIAGATAFTYAFTDIGTTATTTTGKLTITLTSGTLTAGTSVGDTVVLGGFTAPSAQSTFINAAAKLVSYKAGGNSITSGAVPATGLTELVFEYANPYNGALTGFAATTLKLYKSSWAPVSSDFSQVSSASSNFNQLQKFGLIFLVDSVAYAVDNAALTQATIDFGLDAIATIAWTGQATSLRQIDTTLSGTTFTGTDFAGSTAEKKTDAKYITNKLSTVALKSVRKIGDKAAGTNYDVALTGGSITINNNISYITPANLGVVNAPVTYYTGTRAISGTLNAYLKTGTNVGSTGQLLEDMLAGSSKTTEPMISLQIAIGGTNNAVKVVLDMPSATISIPTVDVQQVISTAINFTAQGSALSATADNSVYDLSKSNDITVRYYAA